MDEFENSSIEPEMKLYFKKIMNSFSIGLLWMLSVFTSGLFFELGIIKNNWKWYNLVFYFFALLSLVGLLYFLYKLWKKESSVES